MLEFQTGGGGAWHALLVMAVASCVGQVCSVGACVVRAEGGRLVVARVHVCVCGYVRAVVALVIVDPDIVRAVGVGGQVERVVR